MTKLYVLNPASTKDEARASRDDEAMSWEVVQCAVYGTVPTKRLTPLVIESIPSPVADVSWTWMSDLMVTDRVKYIFEREKITGCKFEPVMSLGAIPPLAAPIRLWELRVTGFTGFADTARGVVIRVRCDDCGLYSYTLGGPFASLVKESSWDGSDVFTMWPFPAVQIGTERVRDVIVRYNVPGVALMPIEEFEVPNGHAAPGFPSEWLNDAALKKLMADGDFSEAVMDRT